MQLDVVSGTDSTDGHVLNIVADTSEISSIVKEIDPDFDDTKLLMSDVYVNQISLDGIANWSELLAEQDTEQLLKDIIYIAVTGYENEEGGRSPFYYSYEALGDSLRQSKSTDMVSLMALSPRSQAASGVPTGISKCRSMLGLPEQPVTASTMSARVRSRRSVDDMQQLDVSVLDDYTEEIENARVTFLSSFTPTGVNKDG